MANILLKVAEKLYSIRVGATYHRACYQKKLNSLQEDYGYLPHINEL